MDDPVDTRPTTVMTTEKARQGETTGRVRRVLGISLALVIVGMVGAYLISF